MSRSGKPVPETDKLSDRLRKSVTCDGDKTDKPDFQELDLRSGSPITHLRTGPAVSSSSSSSGSVSSRTGNVRPVGSGSGARKTDSGTTATNHSGEMSVDSSPTSSADGYRRVKSSHVISETAGPIIGSRIPATSPAVNALPAGNICPSGRGLKIGMMANQRSRPDVLSFGTGNYGHGSVMRGSSSPRSAAKSPVTGDKGKMQTPVSGVSDSPISERPSIDPEDINKLGIEEYRRGRFVEALSFYDRALALSPATAAYHYNRAAAFMGLKLLTQAAEEYDEAIKLDSGYVKAHHRLGSLLIRLGLVENARIHLCFPGSQPDPKEVQKLQEVEKHISKCTGCRRFRDWASVLQECEAAISSGADACPQLFACKAEALLKLRRLDDADLVISELPENKASSSPSLFQVKFFQMLSDAYILFVRAQIDMALGRFENAIACIEKSEIFEPQNMEVSVVVQNIRSLCRARARGNDFFKSEKFMEACSAYGDGLRQDPLNPILYCNRAACWFKLGQLEKSLDDCNQALLIHPKYTKALLRRANTYSKLEKWGESVRDYEVLRKELPDNKEIAESLFHAEVALKKSRGEEVHNMKFGGEVEAITGLGQFNDAIASTGASVVLFSKTSDPQCKQISPFLDTLCIRHPSVNFFKVDIKESPAIASLEYVSIVPTIKIYKKSNLMKELVRPNQQALESSVRHYSL